MTDRTERLEDLVESIRIAELAVEVARATHNSAELADAEATLARLREAHGRLSGWLVEGAE